MDKGMDFKHKEVINIKDGKRLRLCARCMCRFRYRYDYFYNSTLIENRYQTFKIIRKMYRKGYTTRQKQQRTGYVIKEEIVYEVICKVEL